MRWDGPGKDDEILRCDRKQKADFTAKDLEVWMGTSLCVCDDTLGGVWRALHASIGGFGHHKLLTFGVGRDGHLNRPVTTSSSAAVLHS
jgi:hypothetical protein